MSKHKGLPQDLRRQLQALRGAQITEALAELGVKRTHLDDYYESAKEVLGEAYETTKAGRAGRASLMHTQQFPAVSA